MREVTLFGEDEFHELFLAALIERLSEECQVPARVRTYSSRGGITTMHYELGEFLRDIEGSPGALPDAILAATDANCHGYVERRRILERVVAKHAQFQYLVVYAIPDPHIERWAMADPRAFREVFGRGCTLPANKCERDLYKRLLAEAIRSAGISAPLGGKEFASDIVQAMDLARVSISEPSFGRLTGDLRGFFNQWRLSQDAG